MFEKRIKEISENFVNKKDRKNYKQEIKTNNFISDLGKFLEY